VACQEWLATSGSPEQLGRQNRSHTGKECATHSVRVSHRLIPTGTFSASLHRYGDACGECDGVEFAKRRRRDVSDIVEEERQKNRCRPAVTLRADGGIVKLRTAERSWTGRPPSPSFSGRTRRLSPVSERSVPEESMVNCFEVVPTDSKQVLDGTVNREKTLSLCH